jgi:hypothetical protein
MPIKHSVKNTLICSVMLLVGFLLSSSPLYAGTIYQDFSNNSFNTKYFWLNTPDPPDPARPSAAVAHHRLELTVPVNPGELASAGLQNKSGLVGDFDIQVDFNLLTWPGNNGVIAGIITPWYSIARMNSDFGQGPQDTYWVYFAVEGNSPVVWHLVPTSDTSGRLRLHRTGNTISGYYWKDNAWQLIAACTDAQHAEPAVFNVGGYVGNRAASQTLVAFDNLRVTNAMFPSGLASLILLLEN